MCFCRGSDEAVFAFTQFFYLPIKQVEGIESLFHLLLGFSLGFFLLFQRQIDGFSIDGAVDGQARFFQKRLCRDILQFEFSIFLLPLGLCLRHLTLQILGLFPVRLQQRLCILQHLLCGIALIDYGFDDRLIVGVRHMVVLHLAQAERTKFALLQHCPCHFETVFERVFPPVADIPCPIEVVLRHPHPLIKRRHFFFQPFLLVEQGFIGFLCLPGLLRAVGEELHGGNGVIGIDYSTIEPLVIGMELLGIHQFPGLLLLRDGL